ncbi:MAG TPA: hypothetical protein VJ874_06635 [Candidatus Thermoplasmatota archaeon]|nr:hypothetical protein [Candidatus Thermoplasmatota archaeon]
MRALAAVLAVAAALALAGCSSEPNSPVDPETTDADDYELPLVLFTIAVIVGVVLVVLNLSTQGRGNAPPPERPPADPPPPAAWQALDEPTKPIAPPTPKPRRRAP